ncbi:DUF4833 domain-containing protein [Parabacteroides sp. OttesenSCG-928-G06]|nr:DUF4833 domain-containing protein [Parabacteroides sp. OttesenSCG-928-K15]MDL2281982.1 DUF4833 domain-containing protein [Parabacteroides sp. OttesenSCG-928-G06]
MENKKNLRMSSQKIAFSLLFLCVIASMPLQIWAQDNLYPTENRLFHIERSKNKNLVCYDANLKEGRLDTKKPLEIYWIDREDSPGKRKDLTAIQRRMAYGYKLISSGDDKAEITLTAYSGRTLTIQKKDKMYVCTMQINDRPAILQSLYVQAKPNNSLSVEYVELRGIDAETGAPLTERVLPKDE